MTFMSKDGEKRIRVGIIGANPDRGWAAEAHPCSEVALG